MNVSARRPRRGAAVLIRGVALWLLVLGLSYLAFGLLLIDAHRYPQVVDEPWPWLPWGLTESQLLAATRLLAFAGLSSAVLLWRLTRLGRVMSTLLLAGVAGSATWTIWTTEFAFDSLIFAAFNLWLASTLWRSDAAAVFRVEPSVSERAC